MKIYSETPKNWKDLQYKVAKFLSEMGYEAKIENDIHTVGGTINIGLQKITRLL